MKKIVSALLILMLVLAMAIPAMAETPTPTAASGVNSNDGKITIDNAVVDQTYTIYQILSLESYNTASGAYAYKATTAWNSFINSDEIKGVYVNVDAQGYVTWVAGASAADFAKLAQAYAAEKSIANQGSEKAATTTVEFANLNLGYYLVDSTLGTLCSLDTTDPTVTIQEKSGVPSNVKTVEEDSTGAFGTENDADIGQTVNFKSTITAQAGAENYVFHDKMDAGLTYGSVTKITKNGTDVAAENNYTVKTSDLADGCTFEVVFTQTFCDDLKASDEIVIFYTATVNENAVIGLTGNKNESKLEYGQAGSTTITPSSTTTTYTWDMDVLKYANGVEANVLAGAKFVLLSNDSKKVATIAGGKITGWMDIPAEGASWPVGTTLATANNGEELNWPANTVLTTGTDGKIHIEGLDKDNYYLREVEPPLGYNALTSDVSVEIKGKTTGEDGQPTYETYIAKVNNQSGTKLPETGGVGTTIFYVVGGLLVMVAVVLLVTKKKMSVHKD